MGAQPTAPLTLDLSVNATNYEDSLHFTSTVAGGIAFAGAVATSLWTYLYNITGVLATPATTVSFIPGVIRINDVTAPRTTFGYSTTYGTSGNAIAAAQENQHFRWNFHLGPSDFSDWASLRDAVNAQVNQAIAQTPNY